MLESDGSRTLTMVNTDSHGERDRAVTNMSFDGRTVTSTSTSNGAVPIRVTEAKSVASNGDAVDIVSNWEAANPAHLLNRVTTTVSGARAPADRGNRPER